MAKQRIVVMGAAGRDFHDFNVVYRDRAENAAPTPPTLELPLDGASTKTVLAFDWTESTDVDGVTYTLRIARDGAMTDVVYEVEELRGI